MIKKNTQTNTLTPHVSLIFVCLPPCRQILQSSDPGVSFCKARQTELWAVDKEGAAPKMSVVLTGPELVNTGHTGNEVFSHKSHISHLKTTHLSVVRLNQTAKSWAVKPERRPQTTVSSDTSVGFTLETNTFIKHTVI